MNFPLNEVQHLFWSFDYWLNLAAKLIKSKTETMSEKSDPKNHFLFRKACSYKLHPVEGDVPCHCHMVRVGAVELALNSVSISFN